MGSSPTADTMKKQLTELSKEELIEVVQDYQEMVSDLEEYINVHGFSTEELDVLRDILYKERPGWKIHQRRLTRGEDWRKKFFGDKND